MALVWDENRQIVVRIIESQGPKLDKISKIQKSMVEFASRVVICSNQCEHLNARIQQQCRDIYHTIPRAYVENSQSSTAFPQCWGSVSAVLDRFICNLEAAEELLYLCAKVDWKVAALSVFLPASCDPSHSKFALVARDLDWTYLMLLELFGGKEAPTAEQTTSISRCLSVANNLDRSSVLQKLESGPSKKSPRRRQMCVNWLPSKKYLRRQMCVNRRPSKKHREMFDSFLRKRFQEDASPGTPAGSIPNWCWTPGKLEYKMKRLLGSGSSKSVMKCKWLGMYVAIAVYKSEHAKRELETEAGLLASVQHPNVVNLYGCAYDDGQEEGCLVTELMEQDLSWLLKKRSKKRKASQGDGEMPFSLSVSMDIILQIVEAMIHIRKCRVLHRDLKPANILVRAKKRIGQNGGWETYYVVKLIDFGSAKVLGPEASTCHTRKQGTPAYMAPELHASTEDCAYKWSADVYSFGMTMYEILSGRFPFEGVYRGEELARKVCEGERPSFPECIPGVWRELIEKCWHHDPDQRPGFERIKEEILESVVKA